MAAPTDVRVEAVAQTLAVVRWTYGGAANVEIYRSTDGISYSVIATVAAATLSYEDSSVLAGTKYWYKLSDDVGATFSSVVTVVTHACQTGPQSGFMAALALPRFGIEVDPQLLNDAMQQIEAQSVREATADSEECNVCIIDKAIVLDCSSGCRKFTVLVDTEINSITPINCDDDPYEVEFVVPPGTTRGICGWRRGMGFTGDECFQAPVSGGPASGSGRRISETVLPGGMNDNRSSGRSIPNGITSGRGKGAGGQQSIRGCQCIPPANGGLAIKVCSPNGSSRNNNSLGCGTATPGALLVVCGGSGTYTWSTSSGLGLSSTQGKSITVTPPANPGSGEAGTAYHKFNRWNLKNSTPPPVCTSEGLYCRFSYGCADQLLASACGGGADPASTPSCGAVSTDVYCPGDQQACGTPPNGSWNSNTDAANNCAGVSGATCDVRTAGMISAGCNPCGVAAEGAMITVTDSNGASVTIQVGA